MEQINLEQFQRNLVLEHNKCRQDPKEYAKVIERHLAYFIDDLAFKLPNTEVAVQTKEGKKVYQECIDFLNKQEPLGPLDIAEGLCKSSEDHCKDLGPKGITGHNGSDNSAPKDRIERYVKWGVTCSENISFGPKTPEDVIVGLIVDDNVPDRGHRVNIFNKDIKFMGCYLGEHKEFRFMCTINYTGGIEEDKQKGLYFKAEDPNKTQNLTGTKLAKTDIKTTKRKKLTEIEKRVKKEDFFGKMKKIRETGKMLFEGEDYKKHDEHVPFDAVSATIKRVTSIDNGKLVKKIFKTYIKLDGTKHTVEYEDKS